MLVVLFMGYTALWSILNSDKIPLDDSPPMPLKQKLYATRRLFPVLGLILFVLGSIYAGWATATEAAALGVLGALTLSLATGNLSRETFSSSLLGATRTSCMIIFIIAGASFLSLAMGFTGIPRLLAEQISTMGLSPLMLIVVLTLFFMLLGCFLDGISIVVLTTSIILPMIERSGIDLMWFGIYVVLVVEMSQITPPVGFNLFVIQGLTRVNILSIARYALPFFLLLMTAIVLLTAFPEIATWLPRKMTAR
jgi:tripartite ATP-independent transporter DctM subunit